MPDAVAMLLADLARDAARLFVPVACAGCGLDDVPLCESCAALWWEEPFLAHEWAGRLAVVGRSPMPVWAVNELEGPVHRAIATWKDGGRRDLDAVFAAAAGRAAATIAPALSPVGPLMVVPLPSKPRSVRRRGADLTRVLGHSVGRALGAPCVRALEAIGGESRGSSSKGRWASAEVRVTRLPGAGTALLVDDVMSTGATLARAADALEAVSVPVIGALVLAASPRRDVGSRRGLG